MLATLHSHPAAAATADGVGISSGRPGEEQAMAYAIVLPVLIGLFLADRRLIEGRGRWTHR
jgi:hypothetical protein